MPITTPGGRDRSSSLARTVLRLDAEGEIGPATTPVALHAMAWRSVMPAAYNSRTADGARTADRRAAFFHHTACPPAAIARDYRKGLPCTALQRNCTKSPKRFKAGWKPVTSSADNPVHLRHLGAQPAVFAWRESLQRESVQRESVRKENPRKEEDPRKDSLRKDCRHCCSDADEAPPPFVTQTGRECIA
jgi:hypothetical protein